MTEFKIPQFLFSEEGLDRLIAALDEGQKQHLWHRLAADVGRRGARNRWKKVSKQRRHEMAMAMVAARRRKAAQAAV